MAAFSQAGEQSLEIVPGGINLYGADGSRYSIPIPAPLSSVFYLPDGILLKCKAALQFHHSQVLSTFTETSASFTYLTLIQHPYSDLHPLLSHDLMPLMNTSLIILYATKKFPLIVANDPVHDKVLLFILRVNQELIEKELVSLESLDPELRDDSYGKHVANDGLLVLECIFEMDGKDYEVIDVGGYSEKDTLLVYMLHRNCIDVVSIDVSDSGEFPLHCTKNVFSIVNVDSFTVVPREHRIVYPKLRRSSNRTLSFLQDKVQELSCFLYVLHSGTVKIYDGVYYLLSVELSQLIPKAPEPSMKLATPISVTYRNNKIPIHSRFEIQNHLVLRCLSALFSVLPIELCQTIQADVLQKLKESTLRHPEEITDELGKDKNSEWGIFVYIVISLLKQGNQPLVKRQKTLYRDERPGESSSAWETLVNSDFHQISSKHYSNIFSMNPRIVKNYTGEGSELNLQTSPSSFTQHVFELLQTLHLLYEDMKLDSLEKIHLKDLAGLLYTVGKLLGRHAVPFITHYSGDFSDLDFTFGDVEPELEGFVDDYMKVVPCEVYSIYNWLLSILSSTHSEYMSILFEKTQKVCSVLETLFNAPSRSGMSPLAKKQDQDMGSAEKFPIFVYRVTPPPEIDFEAASLPEQVLKTLVQENVTRSDLSRLPVAFALPILECINSMKLSPPLAAKTWPKAALKLIERNDIHLNNLPQAEPKQEYKSSEQHYDHILNLELHTSELTENLSSYIFPHDLRLEEAHCMLDVSKALKIRMPNYVMSEDQFESEKINLLYKICLRRASTCVGFGALELGTSKASPTSTSQVPKINLSAYLPPNYENKMAMPATELENRDKEFLVWPKFHIGVAAGLKMLSEDPRDYVKNRQWITYHREGEDTNEHAGFIMALGLLGQLEALHDLDIYRYLKAEQESIIVAIYLGTSASALGSMDDKIMRILRISIAFLIPPYVDIDIKLTQEAASMLSFGLLYKGSGNRQVSEMLLVQLGRKALTNKDIEREGMSLSSGLALGMVNLGTQANTPGLEDLRIDERLVRLFEGGRRMPPPKILQTGFLINENTKCSVSNEGDQVLTVITAPGALLAYALVHLKSNDILVANKIQVPSTFYELDWVRPEHACIKVLARNLILWDYVQPTEEWLYGQIPALLKFCVGNELKVVREQYSEELDYGTIANCHLYILGGGMMSLGFRFMGSGDRVVARLLIAQVLKLKEYRVQVVGRPMSPTNSNKNNVEKQALFTVMCAGCLALGMVMAGTGDIESFKLLKRIRKRVENDYGFNLAVHQAIGFLFLGNCQYSFSTSDFCIAGMLAAVYPKFPVNASDNRYHLQAYRHLYVLGVEKRLLITRDAVTKELVHVPMEVEYSDIGRVCVESPVLLRPISLCKRIDIKDGQYFEYSLEFPSKLVVYVKKKENDRKIPVAPPEFSGERYIETWVKLNDHPGEFLEVYKNIIPVVKSSEHIRAKEEHIVIDIFRITEAEMPGLLAFYGKIHAENSLSHYCSPQDLYQLIMESNKH